MSLICKRRMEKAETQRSGSRALPSVSQEPKTLDPLFPIMHYTVFGQTLWLRPSAQTSSLLPTWRAVLRAVQTHSSCSPHRASSRLSADFHGAPVAVHTSRGCTDLITHNSLQYRCATFVFKIENMHSCVKLLLKGAICMNFSCKLKKKNQQNVNKY